MRAGLSGLALSLVLGASGAAAQTVWAYGSELRPSMAELAECAAILSLLETEDGVPPSFGDTPVAFERISQEMFYLGTQSHGRSLTRRLVQDARDRWQAEPNSLVAQERLVAALTPCLPLIEVHLAAAEAGHRMRRLSGEDLGLTPLSSE